MHSLNFNTLKFQILSLVDEINTIAKILTFNYKGAGIAVEIQPHNNVYRIYKVVDKEHTQIAEIFIDIYMSEDENKEAQIKKMIEFRNQLETALLFANSMLK